MAATLVVNPGSSSKKYAFFDGVRPLAEYRFERTSHGFEVCTSRSSGQQTCQAVDRAQYASAITMVRELAATHEETSGALDAIGIRIVAPGEYFQTHRVIDDEFIARLQQSTAVAPLHIPVMLAEIEAIRHVLPDVMLVAVSDSAFHATLPPLTRNYSLPEALAKEYGIYRFGYHGLSVASVVRRVHGVFGLTVSRLVVCHIGSGVSVTAVKDGVSVDTSMGFSPGSGLIMGTRAGDVDTGALLELMRAKHWRPLDAQTFLQTSGGLAALAGESDIRTLLDRATHCDVTADHALRAFSFHVARAIATSAVSLGGIDGIVLTATAAERSPELRARLVQSAAFLGAILDADKNEMAVARDAVISAYGSPIKIATMRTDELGEIARIVAHKEW